MGGAAEEIRQQQDDELRRSAAPARRTWRIAALHPETATAFSGFQRRRAAYQQRNRDHHGCGKGGNDQEGRSPIVDGDEPRRQGRHGYRRHSHAGGYERHREAAMRVEPARHAGHHRREDRRGRTTDSQAENELEFNQRCRPARQSQARRQDNRPDQHDRAGSPAVRQTCPRPCSPTPWRQSQWSWRWIRR